MSVKINCLNPIAACGMELLPDTYEVTDNFAEADAVLVRSASMHDLELSDSLLAVARAGAGVNNIPLDKCAEKGIVVFNTPGANANGVKELVVAALLMASRDLVGGYNWVKDNAAEADITKMVEKQKKNYAGNEILGKKLGVIGLGAIGAKVANVALKLGMQVYGYDPYISVDTAWKLSREIKHIANVEDIFKECDYITLHVPLLDSTKGMISKDSIAMMKDGVVLLNFSRDLLVDETALIDALETGKVKKYVTDFANPTVAGAKNTLVTPHLGASTAESEDNCACMAVKELRDYLENGNIHNSVNYPNCDMGICGVAGRIAINHKNVVNMISQFATVLGGAGMNISDMTNKSKGDYAYTLIDLETPATQEIIDKLDEIEGVLKVRIIK